MNTEFCMHCGAKIEYTLQSPNFCFSCGEPFNKEAAAKTKKEDLPNDTPPDNEHDPEGIPTINQLEYSIEEGGGKFTFGDLVARAATDPVEKYEKAPTRPAPAPNPDEDIIKNTINECRSAKGTVELSD